MGDNMATLAYANRWAGIIINGCVRDKAALNTINIGVRALALNPKRSGKQGVGARRVDLTMLGITFRTGDYLYADEDGMITAKAQLVLGSEASLC